MNNYWRLLRKQHHFFIGILLLSVAIFHSAIAAEKQFNVITTFTVIQDIAQNIAGEAATVQSITVVGAEIHGYDPTPKDIARAYSADLILWNGLALERWFERFFVDLADIPAVVVTDGIVPIAIREGHYQGHPNPHAWMSPKLALVYIENIRRAFVQYDPNNASIYNQNAANYAKKINQLDRIFAERFSQIPQAQKWLVTSEGAFSYLAQTYGFKEAYLWPINAEQQGTPKQVKKVIDLVKAHHIPVVFSESTISNKPAIQVSRETGSHYGGVLYVDSISKADGPVPTYFDLLSSTLETIAKGFEQ